MVQPAFLRQRKRAKWHIRLLVLGLLGLFAYAWVQPRPNLTSRRSPGEQGEIAPLVMSGGNPYLRALMRTISASEANDPRPYTILYGGEHIQDLDEHPDRCIKIIAGPNQGMCTTAAGRYQFITTTWQEKADLYHPRPSGWWIWTSYSFEPEYQDEVVYAWLNDPDAWGMDIAAALEAGQVEDVLRLLSGTWTSLGYGIEDNVMTPYLSDIYQQMLEEELAK